MPPPTPSIDGVLVIDKPRGISSMTAVEIVRRKAGGAKTGHAGTLDPLATGVLVMALGKATRIIDQLMATDKQYETVIDLSAFTATDDVEGDREEICVASVPTEAEVSAALGRFRGEIQQRPPAFSAMKVGGRRAYKLARAGEKVEIAARAVQVHDIKLTRFAWPLAEISIHCGKGFYVRSLARNLGETLGMGGHCKAIRRTAVGPFALATARRLEDLPDRLTAADSLPITAALEMVRRDASSNRPSDPT